MIRTRRKCASGYNNKLFNCTEELCHLSSPLVYPLHIYLQYNVIVSLNETKINFGTLTSLKSIAFIDLQVHDVFTCMFNDVINKLISVQCINRLELVYPRMVYMLAIVMPPG